MRGNAVIQDGWALCPRCWGKLCRVLPGGRAQGVVLWCRRCRDYTAPFSFNQESICPLVLGATRGALTFPFWNNNRVGMVIT